MKGPFREVTLPKKQQREMQLAPLLFHVMYICVLEALLHTEVASADLQVETV